MQWCFRTWFDDLTASRNESSVFYEIVLSYCQIPLLAN